MTLLISHIPKSAGSSLCAVVRALSPDTVWAYKGELRLGKPDLEFALKFRASQRPTVVMGHFSYGAHRLLGLDPAYVTVLRDPVERVVSLYRYQKSLPNSPFVAHFRNGISLEDFVSQEITEMTNNHACRVIAGIPPESGMNINERWLLDLALHNLKRDYVLVGTLAKMDDFLGRLGGMLHWPATTLPRVNETIGEAIELNGAQRRAIITRNLLDIELYDSVSSGRVFIDRQ